MDDEAELYLRLRALVGQRCRWADIDWRVVDIIGGNHSLVIQRVTAGPAPIQPDAFGNPSRRAPETRVIPYIDESGDISEEARALLQGRQPA